MSDPAAIRNLLKEAKTIAIVGLSDKPERDSNEVGRYLKSQGYRIIPINPSVPEILGEKSYPSLKEVPRDLRIDIVDVFRKSDAVPGIVEEALALNPLPRAVWLQIGVVDDASGSRVTGHGVTFLQNQCIMVQHKFLMH